ncbi:MAG: hypothetical protein M1829_006131 [Trizodia sp. TS-e1964]|nr:MAG: hypothetical protein M1829_006131 [Trizodia sp. TS-e1964]
MPPPTNPPQTTWHQRTIQLPTLPYGCHLITAQIERALPELASIQTGMLHLFMQHTSAGLSLNENWDADVRSDLRDALDRLVPEDAAEAGDEPEPEGGDSRTQLYRHSAEGPDDMPAHIKAALIGAAVSVPVARGKLLLGTWQGIWYLEFRRGVQRRSVVATLRGEVM